MTTWEEANAAFHRLCGGQLRKPNGTQTGTSVPTDSDYQQIIGTEPEGDTNWGFSLPEGDE